MPGFTHMQIAQPVTFGHHLMAWYEMLERDLSRLADTKKEWTLCLLVQLPYLEQDLKLIEDCLPKS